MEFLVVARSREATSLPPYNITKQWNVLQLLLPYHIKLHILRIVRLQPILLQYIAVRQKCLDFQVCIKFKVCIHFLEIAVIEIKCTIASRCCHCLSSLCVGTLGSIIQSHVGGEPCILLEYYTHWYNSQPAFLPKPCKTYNYSKCYASKYFVVYSI